MTPTKKIVQVAGLLSAALSTGVFFGTRTALGPSTKDFAPGTHVEVQQATVRDLRPVLALPARDRCGRRSAAFALTLIGLLSNLAALVLTGLFELPINARVMTWPPEDPPQGWEDLRDRWDTFPTARTAISVVGLGFLVGAALAPPARPEGDKTIDRKGSDTA